MDAIRFYLQKHYTDEMLAATLAHAQDGKLKYMSCCCLAGIPTADHAFAFDLASSSFAHLTKAFRTLEGAKEAEIEFFGLGLDGLQNTEEHRRALLIPILLEEMARREALRMDGDLLMCELEAGARG